ncbi:MAG: hypothetical protein IPJ41_12310 [Phycisphaerales bacterium]|nr:hypothetical protein [Phycisphaerales bacterium]
MQDDPHTPQDSNELVGARDPGPQPLAPLQQKLSMGLIGIGSILLMVFVFRILWRNRGPKAKAAAAARRQAPRPQPTPAGLHPAHDRLEQTMADAEELTRRLAAILDNKAARIEALIADADDRVAKLSNALSTPAPTPVRERPAETARATLEPERLDPFHRRVYELADQGLSPIDIARRIDKPTGQVELILALRRA